MGFPGQPSQFPTMYPGAYSPGRMLSNNNPELGQLISMFSGSILGGMAGPGSFVPEMNPTQMMVDQFAMKNYQQQVLSSTAHMAHEGQGDFAKVLLGMRSAVTKDPATELNKEQAMNMAGYANNPFVKPFLGAMMGPENLEAMMHGSKGDVHALSNTLNKVNYFRQDPSGVGRMDSESLSAFNKGMYSHLYEPQGNVQSLERQARSTDAAVSSAGTAQLKKAARAEELDVVSDTDAAARLEGLEEAPKKVEALYKKYVAGGKATDTKQQAQELAKYEDALNSAGVLKETETTVGGLVTRANKVPTQELGGFMASQVGKISENMFQRGMMPMAVGNMSAADRARLINTTPLDEETETRLSREMARKDLESKTNKSDKAREFRGLETEKEREEFLDRESNLKPYKETLAKTREKIGKAAEGPMTAESAADLEKLQGFDALSSNVDAKRSADAIKKYTGAVSAIKDIFGDNGNPNAPLPALLAALEGLTGGAIGSMKPEKIQATLRQMQTTAKEAGIGFEQMAAMSSQIDSTGQMLGLTPADTMRIKGGALAAVKVMQDTGSFSNPIYGQSDKGTATQKVAQMMTQGAASRGSRSMAALASIYDLSEKDADGKSTRFKEGSEIAEAMKAYRDDKGDGSYTYTDKDGNKVTKNIREDVGKYGETAVLGILRNSGVTSKEYTAQRDNPLAMENSNNMFGYLTQKHDIRNRVNFADTQGRVMDELSETSIMKGRSRDEQTRIGQALGEATTGLIMETSTEDAETQAKLIEQNLEQKFQAVFDKEYPTDPGLAKAKAKEAAAALGKRSTVNTLVAGANSSYASLSNGGNLREVAQRSAGERDTKTVAEAARSEVRAQQKDKAGMGYSSGWMAETSDYFREITEKGQNFNMDDLLRRVGRVTTDRAVLGKYATGMKGSFDLLAQLKKENFVTNTDISKMDETALRKASGLGADVEIVSNEKAKEERDAAIAGMSKNDEASKKAVAEAFKKHVKTAGTVDPKMSDKRQAQLVAELKSNPEFLAEMEKKVLGEKRISRTQAEDKASQAIAGEAKDGMEARAADVNAFEKSLLAGSDESTLNAGVHATLRLGGITANEEQTKSLMEAVRDTSPEGEKKLKDVLDDFETKGVIKDADTRKFATTAFGGIQKGIPLEIAKTLGMAKFTDRELTQELTAQYKARGMQAEEAQAAAKETADKVTAQKEAAEKAGGTATQTTEEQRVEQQKHLEGVLQEDYIKNRNMTPDQAREAAVIDAAAVTKNIGEKRAAEGAEGAGDSRQQRVDTLEVHAQNVIIKSGKVEGESGGAKATAPQAAGGTNAPQKANIIDKVLSGDVEGALSDIKGGDGASLMDSAFVTELTTLEGKPPVQVKPGEEKPDVPLSKPEPAPAPAAPEPEKVAQASGEQLKHDKGVATNAPTAAADPRPAPAPSEKKTAYDLTEADLKAAIGGDKAIAGSDNKNTEFLQSKGLLENIKGIKDARQRGSDADEADLEEEFETGMRDAIASGLIPHPVDEDGDPITDFTSDEAIAAAEKHLEKYLPEDKKAAPDLATYEQGGEQFGPKAQAAEAAQQKLVPESATSAAATENVPPSMLDAVNEAIQSPSGQAVLSGASALYNKYAPDFVKGAIKKAAPDYIEKDERAEYISGKFGGRLTKRATESKDAPFDELGAEVGVDSQSNTTVVNDELDDTIKQEKAAEITGSPLEQIMYALSKGEMPAQTFTKGSMAAHQIVAKNDELVAERLVPLPDSLKDAATNYGVAKRDPNEEQYRLQGVYAENHARYAAATTDSEKENAERHKKSGIALMGQHNAAREAGIDTTDGVRYDEHEGTINGKKVGKDVVDRHVRLLQEKAAKDPLAIVSDDVQKTLKLGKYSESEAVKTANEEQLKKTAGVSSPAEQKTGVSSANVSPEAAAKTAADAAQAAAQGPVAAAVGADSLAAAVPETEMTRPNSAPINRVQAMAADTPVGPAPGAGAGGGNCGAGGSSMTINGTLTLSGLQEAILNAQGGQVMQTDGGAPVVIDPIMQQRTAAPPKNYA